MPQENNNKVPVVHLITLLELGGAQGNTIHTVTHLNPGRFDVHLWSGKGAYFDKEVESRVKSTNLKFFTHLVRQISPIRDFLAFLGLFYELKRLKPLILHTHSSKAGILGRFAGWMARVPVIIHTFHGFGFNPYQKSWARFLFVFLERLTARFSTALIFVSKSNMENAKKLKIGDERQYHLIRSGVPIPDIRHSGTSSDRRRVRKELGLENSQSVVTTIGAFKPQKNLLDFIELAGKIRTSINNAVFLVIGDGKMRPEIERKISDLNLQKYVHLLGWRRDIPRLLATSDVFVLTSLWEGLPRALVEAMILGVPSLCYATDGVSDMLHGRSDLVATPGDVNGLARLIVGLLQDHGKYEDVSKFVKNQIGDEFDIDKMVTRQQDLYEDLIIQRIRPH